MARVEADVSTNKIALGSGRVLAHKQKVRASLVARFREANPVTTAFINDLVLVEGPAEIKVRDSAIKGFPSPEVIGVCAFLAEVTKDVEGFPGYEWESMDEEKRVDFFDLELSEIERVSYLVAVYYKLFARH